MSAQQSEVASLLDDINRQYVACHTAVYGLAAGTARHDFISARMDSIEKTRQQLIATIGDEHEAMTLIIQEIDKSSTEGNATATTQQP